MRGQSSIAGPLKVAALSVALASSGLHEAVRQSSLSNIDNSDFWWHLRVGLGIIQSHTLPRTGLYSQSATLPWMASSWLYDLSVAGMYQTLGLSVIPLIAVAFKLALASLIFVLAGGLRGRFWTAISLTIVVQYTLHALPPLPTYCSVLAFAIELILLMRAQRTGNIKCLFSLPLLLLIWANVDVQFVYGSIFLLLFWGADVLGQAMAQSGNDWLGQPTKLPLKQLSGITAASLIATIFTPYGWNPYTLFFTQATSVANVYLPHHQALRFRSPEDYVLMLLAMAAFLALGLRRSRSTFQIGLLVVCTLLAFRSQAESWLVVIAATAVLANALPSTESEPAGHIPTWQCAVAGVIAVAVLTVVTVKHLPSGRNAVMAKVGQGFPVAAAEYIRANRLPQPLFNAFPWGGFLTWYLPEYPVAIDGRTDLYGDDFNIRYAKVMNAEEHYSTFAPFNQAGTILLEKSSLMGKALPGVSGFKVAYDDDLSVVLVREWQSP